VLTLRGADFYSRIGVQAMAGLPELVAEDWDDYVARAVALTDDLTALDALRRRVRPTFESGPMCDEAGFVRRLEATFRRVFEDWRGERAEAAA
jgi:predicted O-linked N-acetylglucosamine transferase (SPINDLY family)